VTYYPCQRARKASDSGDTVDGSDGKRFWQHSKSARARIYPGSTVHPPFIIHLETSSVLLIFGLQQHYNKRTSPGQHFPILPSPAVSILIDLSHADADETKPVHVPWKEDHSASE